MYKESFENQITLLNKGLEICNRKIRSKNPFIFKRHWREKRILIESHISDLELVLKDYGL